MGTEIVRAYIDGARILVDTVRVQFTATLNREGLTGSKNTFIIRTEISVIALRLVQATVGFVRIRADTVFTGFRGAEISISTIQVDITSASGSR